MRHQMDVNSEGAITESGENNRGDPELPGARRLFKDKPEVSEDNRVCLPLI